MKVTIEEIHNQDDDEIIIRCKKITDKYTKILELLKFPDHIVAYKDNSMHKVNIKDIFYFEVVDKKVFLYSQSEVYEVKQKFGELENLVGQDFMRISRIVIANWRKIDSLRPTLNGRLEAKLDNGERVIISRQYMGELKKRFLDLENQTQGDLS